MNYTRRVVKSVLRILNYNHRNDKKKERKKKCKLMCINILQTAAKLETTRARQTRIYLSLLSIV